MAEALSLDTPGFKGAAGTVLKRSVADSGAVHAVFLISECKDVFLTNGPLLAETPVCPSQGTEKKIQL